MGGCYWPTRKNICVGLTKSEQLAAREKCIKREGKSPLVLRIGDIFI